MATQAERRTSTRSRILDAALSCLVEVGVGGFTTTAVVERAGVSRGALFDHFPTKAHLEAATIEALFADLRAGYEGRFRALRPRQRTLAKAADLLAEVFADERLLAVYGWFVASRTDPRLQAALTPVVSEHLSRLRELGVELLVGADAPDDLRRPVADMVELAVMAMQGLAIHQLAAPAPGASQRLKAQILTLAQARLQVDQGAT